MRRFAAALFGTSFLLACSAAPAPTPAPAVATVPPAAVIAAPVPSVPVQWRGEFRQGELIVGRIVGKPAAGARVRVLDRDVRVSADGIFVFGLDRDAATEVTVDIAFADGTSWRETRPVAPREYNIQRVTGIPEKIMKPSPADLERIARDSAQVAAARRRDDDRPDFLQSFIWPVAGPVTGVFGSQRYYNGVPGRPHYGVDVGVPAGTLIVAPAAGIVTVAVPDMFYSGGTLIIDHGHGVSSTLMHLSKLLVKEGERVEQGQPVAKSGASGRASGPHLDWRMNWFGQHIDAQRLVPPMPLPAEPQK